MTTLALPHPQLREPSGQPWGRFVPKYYLETKPFPFSARAAAVGKIPEFLQWTLFCTKGYFWMLHIFRLEEQARSSARTFKV